MRTLSIVLLSLAFALAVPAASASPAVEADARCMGPVCDAVNDVCQAVFGISCVRSGAEASAADCVGIPCDQINFVCYTVFRQYCLG